MNEFVDTLDLPFTADERAALCTKEQTIRVGLRTFLEVGEALAFIRDQRLYREEFSTFEDYCKTKWNITARRSRQLIDAHDVVAALPMGTTVPTNEAQARQLVGLTPTEAASVMEKAAENKVITAAGIKHAKDYIRNGRPTSTGMTELARDVPAPSRKARQRPLPDAYGDLVYAINKRTASLSRLHQDDRFERNRNSGALDRWSAHLAMAANELCDLLDDLGVDRHRYGGVR